MRAGMALAIVAAGAATLAAQAVFRGGAQTVAVYATVRDAQGRLVPGLTRTDFQVFDDGRPAAVTTFSNDVLPAGIALLLDMSTSMLGEHVRVRDAALHFVNALLPDDRVRIGTFGDEIMLSPWLTSDKQILARILREEVWPGGETPLWSAMHAAMTSLEEEQARRVVVALTDGIDTGCPRPPCPRFDDVEQLALEREVMIYAISMEGPGLAGGLIKLTDATGGGRFELKRNEDLAPAFREVLDELHHQYGIGFTPVALDGRVHPLEVRLTRQGLSARARKSYLAVDR
jgi:VWFA-related protein